jgi:hypothetical protein
MTTVFGTIVRRAAALPLTFLMACGDMPETESAATPNAHGPTLTALEVVRLHEDDTLFLAHPVSLVIDPVDGSFFIADVQTSRASHYGRDGAIRHVYGAPGQGPEELRLLLSAFPANDAVALLDAGSATVKLFERESAVFERSTMFVGIPAAYQHAAQDTAWLGVRNTLLNAVVMAWDIETDSMRYIGPIPDEYGQYPNILRFDGLPVIKWADTVLVGFSPLNGLMLMTSAGRVLDTLVVPFRRRRGVRAEVIEAAGGAFAPLMNGISGLVGLWRLTGGEIALVHYDNHVQGENSPRITATLYLSVLAHTLDRACVDQVVPIAADAQPMVNFRGDTLFVLHQQVADTLAATSISLFRITMEACDWLPLGPSTGFIQSPH